MRWRDKPLQRRENSQDTVLFLARFAEPKLDATHIFGSQNLLIWMNDSLCRIGILGDEK